jgi:hypothetical protein
MHVECAVGRPGREFRFARLAWSTIGYKGTGNKKSNRTAFGADCRFQVGSYCLSVSGFQPCSCGLKLEASKKEVRAHWPSI